MSFSYYQKKYFKIKINNTNISKIITLNIWIKKTIKLKQNTNNSKLKTKYLI